MKQQQIVGVWLAVAGVALLWSSGLAADRATRSKVPTGTYVSVTGIPETFVVHLRTNGEYRVETRGRIGGQSQQGRWGWSDKLQEFLLKPAANSDRFAYEFRRLRVHPDEADTLQWIPLSGGGGGAGAIDYVKFKRRKK